MTILNSNLKLRLVSSVLAILLAIGNTSPAFPQEPSKDVAITFISGEVLVLKKGATEWQTAKPGDILSEGDSIKTLEGAKAKLQFPSGSSIILKENTSLVIDKLATKGGAAEGKTEVSLPKGRVKALIERLLDKESEFEVRTPTAVAGVAGTVFYLNVVKKTECIMASATNDKGTKYAYARPSIGLLFTDLIMGGAKECYAEGEDVVTEIFVEKGNVNFTNLISNISYNVGENKGSFADEEGRIPEPKYVQPEKQKAWKAGFELPKKKEEKKKEEKDKKKKEKKKKEEAKKEPETTPVTRKAEKSVVEKEAPEETTTTDEGAAGPEIEIPETYEETLDPDESKDDQEDNKTKTETQDTDTDVNVTVTTEVGETDVDITIITDEERLRLREELVELHNDIVEVEQRIKLAQLDARLAKIEDAQDGKVIKDMHGNTVRYANYVLRPTDNKVAILFLNHRRAGADRHEGVSSLSFEVAFDRNLPSDLKSLPWSDYMGSDDIIYYSNDPAGLPLPTEMILKASNPADDSVELWEEFSTLETNVGGTSWWQDNIIPDPCGKINGKNGEVSLHKADIGWSVTDKTLNINGYLIEDYDPDIAGAPTATAFPLHSIRGIIRDGRTDNLELIFESDEFEGDTIDVIVAPEIMDPYHDND